MIQEIAPSVFAPAYDTREPDADACLMIFEGDRLHGHIDASSRLVLPRLSQTRAKAEDCVFLFSVDDRAYFSAPSDATEGAAPESLPLRHVMASCAAPDAFAAATAYHLTRWYESTRYCGACAAQMERDAKERAMRCPSCGAVLYPRINPSIVVGVTDGDRILLTKYTERHGQTKYYALIAGFCEIGESAEDTVRREVWEEVGLRVKNIRYWGSQPWGVAGNLTLGFTAELDGDDTITMDETELSRAVWTARDEVPVRDVRLSLTAEMMRAFRDGEF